MEAGLQHRKTAQVIGIFVTVKIRRTAKRRTLALSTPASETLIKIEAQPVVDKAVEEKTIIFEKSN
jgi:hypothetical protein